MESLVLDIETIRPTEDDMQVELDMIKPAANIKDPAKKRANVKSQQDKAKQKPGLLESARIGCVGLLANDWITCFTSYHVPVDEVLKLANSGLIISSATSEKQMLINLYDFLDKLEGEYELTTFNGKNFDLPRLRFRYARNAMQIPELFGRYTKHNDLMLSYIHFYSQQRTPFISMSEVAVRLGVLPENKMITGADFQGMIDDGDTLLATLYNVFDLCITKAISLRLNA